MVMETQEASPAPCDVKRRSPRNTRPVVRRSRLNSSESENSTGSGKSRGSRSNTPGPNTPSGSQSASRGPSFRNERPPNTVSSKRSPASASSGQRNASNGRDGGKVNSITNVNSVINSSNGNQSRTSLEQFGPRRLSMPNVTEHLLSVPNAEESRDSRLRRVRSFKTTSKGVVVNRGDSFKIKSTNSLMSAGSAITEANKSQQLPAPVLVSDNDGLTPDAPHTPTYYRVIMMGGAGCGKSLMAKQFLTSDYVGGCDDSVESHVNTVSVLLDGEESTIEFIDPPDRNVIDESLHHLLDAYVVVFAINDHGSFDQAQQLVRYLRVDHGTDRVILLVANKIDLVRKRKVTADEARLVSETYDCKYAETSAALNHHVDELLVGILTQIRLHMRIPFTTISFPGKDSNKADRKKEKKKSLKGPRGFFYRLFRRTRRKKPKACENLYEL